MAYKLKSNVKSLCNNSALPNLKSGGKMISSDKGSSNYMKEDTGSAILQGGRKRVGGRVGGSVASAGTSTPVKPLSAKEKAFFNTSNLPTKTERLAKEAKENDTGKKAGAKGGTKEVTKKVTKKVVKEEVKGPSSAQTKAQELEKRAKTAISKQKRKPKTEDGVNAVRDFQANKKKKGKEMSRGEIKEAKKKDKDSGMSRKEVRLNKTKRKAASTRAKTVSKETAAKGGKEAQRLARKTIRLEKKAAKIEGRVKASKIK
jgi:hypothetical protein